MNAVANELNAVEKILDLLVNLDAKVKNVFWPRKARAILERLRDIYFHESGTLGFLRGIANGDPVPPSTLEKVKSNFFKQQPIVEEALNELKTKSDFKDIRFSLDESRLIEDIIHDKTTIREWVRDIFYALEQDKIGDWERGRAQELCECIENLNAKFHDVDARLRHRR